MSLKNAFDCFAVRFILFFDQVFIHKVERQCLFEFINALPADRFVYRVCDGASVDLAVKSFRDEAIALLFIRFGPFDLRGTARGARRAARVRFFADSFRLPINVQCITFIDAVSDKLSVCSDVKKLPERVKLFFLLRSMTGN